MRRPRSANREDVIAVDAKTSARATAAAEAIPPAACASYDANPARATLVSICDDASSPAYANPADRLAHAQRILKNHVYAAGGVAFVPVPGADLLGLTGIQANMIEEISSVYGYCPTPGWSLRLAGLFALSLGFLEVGKAAASSALKMIPGFGTAVGVGGLAAYSAATTYALGKSIIQHYQAGQAPDHLLYDSIVQSARKLTGEGLRFWKKR